MTKKNAVLFNGAASLIAQEVGLIDLLIEFKGLSIHQNESFLAGLSSGGLMTFAVNSSFSDKPPISWNSLKEEVLFPLKTADVYTGTSLPFDTTPLRNLLTALQERTGYETLGNLPFPSAILTLSDFTLTTCWLNTVTNEIPSGQAIIHKQIREHALELDMVDVLMCSTAIPVVFPAQNLQYFQGDNKKYINGLFGQKALFSDGGTLGIFKRFAEFFNAYNETFDDIYFITPDFTGTEQETAELLGESLAKEAKVLLKLTQADPVFDFINALKAYNKQYGLAKNIYFCKPEVSKFNPLDFDTLQEQYNETVAWGKANPDKIAININDL